jgi:hypothetical protein
MKLKQASTSFPRWAVSFQNLVHCIPISRPVIWGFDESDFHVFSSFKATLVCSLPIFQGIMLRGTIRMPSPLLTFLVLTLHKYWYGHISNWQDVSRIWGAWFCKHWKYCNRDGILFFLFIYIPGFFKWTIQIMFSWPMSSLGSWC